DLAEVPLTSCRSFFSPHASCLHPSPHQLLEQRAGSGLMDQEAANTLQSMYLSLLGVPHGWSAFSAASLFSLDKRHRNGQ
ncbi:hypothetical protein KUCAC02_009843, partial [Chaenocephalus aceratus]